MRIATWILSCLLICLAGQLFGQTFSFQCVCNARLTGDTCDICPTTTVQSRSFTGLLIYRNGTPYRWLDEPYTIRKQPGEFLEFWEQTPNPDKISISRSQTSFATMQGFIDSTFCQCNIDSGGATVIVVDTPIIGDGTVGNPVTIGQFGADTTMVLKWNGEYWFPAKLPFSALLNDLPYFINDDAAITGGLSVGQTYLLASQNTFAMPVGLYKVVIGCGFTCSLVMRYFPNDAVALSNNIPSGREYILDENNLYGVLYGFVKTIPADLPADSLQCNSPVLPFYISDAAAITGGLSAGDFYTTSSANVYGAPHGMERAVSTTASITADPPNCCDDATLPYFANDAAAITGGLSSGYYYYLSSNNTLGFPHGSKKVIP